MIEREVIPVEPVYADDVAPFFKEKGVKEECECCGKKDWIIINNLFGIATLMCDDDLTAGFTPTIIVQCTNCGNMRLFNRAHLNLEKDKKL